jgi:hypothetical protein
MLITLHDHALVQDLCAHFTRSGFGAEPVGGGMVEITRADAPSLEQEQREVELHLRVWQVANPGAAVDLA